MGFNKLKAKAVPIPINFSATEFISIIISARNESQTIINCLEQFNKQDFPTNKFEIIIIDDASEDDTFKVAKTFLEKTKITHQVIKMPTHQGKKRCISQAISLAQGNIIITSDADIVFRHTQFLNTVSYYFETHKPAMLVMPIDFETEKGLLTAFQITENMALAGITAGFIGINKPMLCNGANLAFDKNAFMAANGYQSHLSISSGEDVLLLEDLKNKFTSQSIHYGFYRELIAKTISEKTMASLFNQRVRWAYKSKYNPNSLNILMGLIVMLANLLLIALVFTYFQKPILTNYFVTFVTAKFVFDFSLMLLTADFLGRIKYIKWFLPFQCLYGVYSIVVGFSSLFYKPKWKNKNLF